MKDLSTISRAYFLGIGGIGMSALARYFVSKNVIVSGYDKTRTPLTEKLEQEGIQMHYNDDINMADKSADIVVYTPAIPRDMAELNYFRDNNYELLKRSDVLQIITESSFNICVAGTHGKTTITTMLAHLLRHSGFGCNAFLGGISTNYHTNFWSSANNVAVVEADEYDRSFLKLSPDVAVITAMDADHLDIYGTKENMQEAFVMFADNVKHDGLLLTNFSIPQQKFNSHNHLRYSLQNDSADVYASNIVMRSGGYEFDVNGKDWKIEKIKLHMGGMHNVENAVATIGVAHYLKIADLKIANGIATFRGVKRRFEYIIDPHEAPHNKNNVIFIDDYAHHPAELDALIRGAKSLFSFRKCTVIFQPHLYSRTKDFAKEFAESLSRADRVILLPIYPAREKPMEGVSSELILQQMKNLPSNYGEANATVLTKEELPDYLKGEYLKSIHAAPSGEVLITAGAGDIDKMIQPIKEILLNA